jgi:hypothetical protein
MTRTPALLATLIASTLVAGCSSLVDPVQRDTAAVSADLAATSALPVTAVLSVPTSGTAAYSGAMAADVSGDYTGSMYGDLAMNVDFASGDVTGQISHVDLVDQSGYTVENMDGTLAIAGSQVAGIVATAATGTLTGLSGPVVGAGVANFALGGTLRDDTGTADAVYGSVTGNVTGNYTLDLANGQFYGTTH